MKTGLLASLLVGCTGILPGGERDPHLLVIGGGAVPQNNQVSLEKNVEYFWRLKQGWGLEEAPETLFFADGDTAVRDLQIYDPDKPATELARALSLIFTGDVELNYRYRNHKLPGAQETGTEGIGRYFDGLGLGDGDGLFVYYTGHGGRGTREAKENTCLYLWGRKQLRAADFSVMLDKVKPEVPVTLLMVQCYSGGFGNVLFKGGDPKNGLAEHARCGFFATLPSREAAGCTPSVDESDYREYSSYFLAALGGKTRVGEPVEGWDLDGDGTVSFLEAHAYAVVESETIDVPVRTGGIFLRTFSRLPDGNKSSDSELLGIGSYGALLEVAGVNDRKILEGLSERMGLEGDGRAAAVMEAEEKIRKERDAVDRERKAAKKEVDGVRSGLKLAVGMRWPELANQWDVEAGKVMAEEGDAVVEYLKENEEFGKLLAARQKYLDADELFFELDEEWALRARFLRTAGNVAREVNLPKVAGEDVVRRYQEILELEGRSF